MGWRDRSTSDRKRILAGVILVVSGGVIIFSYQTAGLEPIGVALLLFGVVALAKKPNRDGPTISDAKPATALPSPAFGVTEGDDLVPVAEFNSDDEAQVAHALMKSAGIPSFLKNSMTAVQYPNWARVGEQGRLLIAPSSFLAQAQELLQSHVSEEDLIAAAEAAQFPSDEDRTDERRKR